MTPCLQQAIKLLQMSKLEFLEEVATELVENPALEEGQSAETGPGALLRGGGSPRADLHPVKHHDAREGPLRRDRLRVVFRGLEGGYTPRASIEQRRAALTKTSDARPEADRYLLWQLDMSKVSAVTAEIGRAIIGNLDEDGFLQATIDEFADGGLPRGGSQGHGGGPPVRIRRRRGPHVQECLLRQIDHLDLEGTPASTIVHDHLEKLQAEEVPGDRRGARLHDGRARPSTRDRQAPRPAARGRSTTPRAAATSSPTSTSSRSTRGTRWSSTRRGFRACRSALSTAAWPAEQPTARRETRRRRTRPRRRSVPPSG